MCPCGPNTVIPTSKRCLIGLGKMGVVDPTLSEGDSFAGAQDFGDALKGPSAIRVVSGI